MLHLSLELREVWGGVLELPQSGFPLVHIKMFILLIAGEDLCTEQNTKCWQVAKFQCWQWLYLDQVLPAG